MTALIFFKGPYFMKQNHRILRPEEKDMSHPRGRGSRTPRVTLRSVSIDKAHVAAYEVSLFIMKYAQRLGAYVGPSLCNYAFGNASVYWGGGRGRRAASLKD